MENVEGERYWEALESRLVIERAKGMLMQQFDLDDNDAFELLKRLSQGTNVKVADIARQLVYRYGRERQSAS